MQKVPFEKTIKLVKTKMNNSLIFVWVGWIVMSITATLYYENVLLLIGLIGFGLFVAGVSLSNTKNSTRKKVKQK